MPFESAPVRPSSACRRAQGERRYIQIPFVLSVALAKSKDANPLHVEEDRLLGALQMDVELVNRWRVIAFLLDGYERFAPVGAVHG